MSISSLNSGASSLKAFQTALDSSAHNVANASTKGFQPQVATFSELENGGVVVNISQSSARLADPAQQAELDSGTDFATEIINSLQYQSRYELAAKLIKTSDEMLGTLIDIRK